MSIASTTNRVDYTGNGAVDTYAYTFRIFSKTDLKVTVRNTASPPVETTLTVDTHYTVTGAGDENGGNVALVNGAFDWLDADGDLKTNYRLTIRRVRPLTQTTDIRNQGDFFPETHEDSFDHGVMIAQQLDEEIDRSVKNPETVPTSTFSPTLPTDIATADKALVTNPSGNGFKMGPTVSEISSAQTHATNAAASATTAQNYATKTDGYAASTDNSSKSWAIGGTGDGQPTAGPAKDWATKTSAAVSGTDYSAKEYAQGTQASTGGSAKNWAQQTGADVTGASAGDKSAKSWAQETGANAPTAGSAKEWATETGVVDGGLKGAKGYAEDASTSATAAAASATAAQTAADSALWQDVLFKTAHYTVVAGDRGKLICCDCTGGAITITLPQISGLTLSDPWSIGIKKTDSSGNAVTVNRAGTDTIDGATSKTISSADSGAVFIPDTDPTPDEWTTAEFGASAGNLTVDRFSGNGSAVNFTLSVDPGSENNTWVHVSGVYQQKDTYSVSGTTLTFSAAPPTGTNNIEVIIGTSLSIGTPSDGTVTAAKLTYSAVNGQTAETAPATGDEVLLADASAAALRKMTLANVRKAVIPKHYRDGMFCRQASTTTLTVGVGVLDVAGLEVSLDVETTLNITTAAHWAGGASLRAVDTTGFIGVDASGNIKLHTTAPTHSDSALSITAGKKRYVSWSSTTYRVIGWFRMNSTGSGELDAFGVSNIADGNARNEVYRAYTEVATGTTTLPFDDTIPQNTEGVQFMIVGFRPTHENSKICIQAHANTANSNSGGGQTIALFQDSTANALKANGNQGDNATNNAPVPLSMFHEMKAAAVSFTEFKIRCGGNGAGTITFNGSSGARIYGGVMGSFIRIWEEDAPLN